MSSAYRKAIGYGMPWPRFEELYLGDCETHLTLDHLESVLAAATDEMLTVDAEFYRECFYTDHVPSVRETRLLSRSFTNGGRRPADIGNPGDLMQVVLLAGDSEARLVLFFPNLRCAKAWQRRNDPLDLAFDRWKDGVRKEDAYRVTNFIEELPYGHDSYESYLMRKDGTPVEWHTNKDPEHRGGIVPAVPKEYHFYMKKLGILNEAGINELRPYIAQWWS